MIPIILLPLPNGGNVLAKTEDIGGAISNEGKTDIYVLGWAPQGITIDMSIEDFAEVWVSALFEDRSKEYEIIYPADSVH